MAIDWNTSELAEQLARHAITTADNSHQLCLLLNAEAADVARLFLKIVRLDTYAEIYGIGAGVWIVLAVVRMLKEILADYAGTTQFGCIPPDTFVITTSEDHQQEIGHRCLTGYQEIYDVLMRIHYKPGSPIWHRWAVVQSFPELTLDVETTGTALQDSDGD
jgi:hypothetical protein